MPTALRIAPLVAFAALIMTGSLSAAHATSCEAALKSTYRCTATLSDGQSTDYCLRPDVDLPGDGIFGLYEEFSAYFCTCEAKGRVPNVQFGASSRDFFCGNFQGTAVVGRVTPARITGQAYSLNVALRSVFSCEAVATCP